MNIASLLRGRAVAVKEEWLFDTTERLRRNHGVSTLATPTFVDIVGVSRNENDCWKQKCMRCTQVGKTHQ